MTVQVGDSEVAKVMIGNTSLFDGSSNWTEVDTSEATNTIHGNCFFNYSNGVLTVCGSVIQDRDYTGSSVISKLGSLPNKLASEKWTLNVKEYSGGDSQGGYTVSCSVFISNGIVCFSAGANGLTSQVTGSFKADFIKS